MSHLSPPLRASRRGVPGGGSATAAAAGGVRGEYCRLSSCFWKGSELWADFSLGGRGLGLQGKRWVALVLGIKILPRETSTAR